MSKKFFTSLLCFLVLLSSVSINQNVLAQVKDTEEEFFEDGSDEPLPQISEEDSVEPLEETSAELDSEPVPQIRRKPEPFDPRKARGTQRIKHPLAEKGLIRITKDKTYIYKTKSTPQDRAMSVRFGMYEPINLENTDNQTSFEENYPESNSPIVLIDYEWQLWKSRLGKIGLKAGSGLFFANGNGRFKNDFDENRNRDPQEVFTFIAFPNTAGAVYRAQFWDKQILIPYADGGVMGWTFAELRDDGGNPKFGFSPAGYAAGGIQINLTSFDAISAFNLDAEYGINAVHVALEYRNMVSFGGKFDFSSDLINGGFLMEF